MRRIPFQLAVLTLSALAFVSCKKDDKPAATGDMMTFTGRIGNGGAKTEINGFDMTWSDGDKVRINGEVFESELTSDRKTATFTGEYLMPPYEAYYPAGLYDETENKYVLPATQTCYPDSVNTLSDINPMYAKSNTTDLQFYNICAMVKLVVSGEGTVKKITVSANDKDGQPALLSGAFAIKGDASAGFYAEMKSASDGGSESLTLDCGDGVTLSKTAATTFYVALPQGEYTDLKFTLTGRGDITWSSSPVTRNLKAGKMQVRELADVKFVKPATLPGEFTINSGGTKVKFSKGNLWYDGVKFHFEENQWETTPSAVGQTDGSGQYDSSHVSRFLWSPDKSVAVDTSTAVSGGMSDVFFTNATQTTASQNFQVDGEEAGTWRTLSEDEWRYLLNTDNAASGARTDANRFARAKVNGVQGLLIFPDGYNNGTAISGITGVSTVNSTSADPSAAYPSDNIPSSTWASMESSGAVFLPASGNRFGMDVDGVGSFGIYWASTPSGTEYDAYDTDYAHDMFFDLDYVYIDYGSRCVGHSVRLVR